MNNQEETSVLHQGSSPPYQNAMQQQLSFASLEEMKKNPESVQFLAEKEAFDAPFWNNSNNLEINESVLKSIELIDRFISSLSVHGKASKLEVERNQLGERKGMLRNIVFPPIFQNTSSDIIILKDVSEQDAKYFENNTNIEIRNGGNGKKIIKGKFNILLPILMNNMANISPNTLSSFALGTQDALEKVRGKNEKYSMGMWIFSFAISGITFLTTFIAGGLPVIVIFAISSAAGLLGSIIGNLMKIIKIPKHKRQFIEAGKIYLEWVDDPFNKIRKNIANLKHVAHNVMNANNQMNEIKKYAEQQKELKKKAEESKEELKENSQKKPT